MLVARKGVIVMETLFRRPEAETAWMLGSSGAHGYLGPVGDEPVQVVVLQYVSWLLRILYPARQES